MLLGAEEYAAEHKGRIKDRGLSLVPFMTVTHLMKVNTESCTQTQKKLQGIVQILLVDCFSHVCKVL